MTTYSHFDQAVEYLELAIIEYFSAKSRAEQVGWKQKHIERIDLIKRATARVRRDMIEEMAKESQQEKFEFEKALEVA